jgi:hypothetical protein
MCKMDSPKTHSRLFYFGTKTEIMLGDEILWKRFMRRGIRGKVSYIPGISPKHSDFEYEGIKQWAISLEDSQILMMIYHPTECQPKKNILFLNRGAPKSFSVEERVY